MWNVLKKDLQEFVSVVTGDTKEVLEKVLQKDGEEEEGGSVRGKERGIHVPPDGIESTPEVLALQNDPKTYTEAVDAADAGRWATFMSEFDLAAKAAEIEKTLKENPKMAKLHGEFVNEELTSEAFWTRYYFKVSGLQRRKGPLPLDLADDEEEELSWGDDEESPSPPRATSKAPPPVSSPAADEEGGQGEQTAGVPSKSKTPSPIPPARAPTPSSTTSTQTTTTSAAGSLENQGKGVIIDHEGQKEMVALREEVMGLRERLKQMEAQAEGHVTEMNKVKGMALTYKKEKEALSANVKALKNELAQTKKELEMQRNAAAQARHEAATLASTRNQASLPSVSPSPYPPPPPSTGRIESQPQIVRASDAEEGEEGWEEEGWD